MGVYIFWLQAQINTWNKGICPLPRKKLQFIDFIQGLFKKVLVFFVLFFRQHWKKLPREECSRGLYDHTVKVWRLYVCFSSCFSLVKVELSVAGATKFGMCVVVRFLHVEGQPAIGILSNWSLKIKNGMRPPFWVRIGLNCIFSLWDTSEVDFKGKKTEKWLGIPSNWLLKIQNGMRPPLWVWIVLNCIFSL